MAHDLKWIEDLLMAVEASCQTLEGKVITITHPDDWRTTDALELTKINKRFFDDLKVMENSLNEAVTIAGEIMATIDQAMADREDKLNIDH